MKKSILIFALATLAGTFTVSCSKKSSPEPEQVTISTTTTTTVVPTVDIECFINASCYDINVMTKGGVNFNVSLMKANKVFTPLGNSNVCTTSGAKLTVPYSKTDTTICQLYFYSNSSSQIPRESCEIKIDTSGNLHLYYFNTYSSGLLPASIASCKKALISE